jgi:hypothetical protein
MGTLHYLESSESLLQPKNAWVAVVSCPAASRANGRGQRCTMAAEAGHGSLGRARRRAGARLSVQPWQHVERLCCGFPNGVASCSGLDGLA